MLEPAPLDAAGDGHFEDDELERITTADIRKVGSFLRPFLAPRGRILVVLLVVLLLETGVNLCFPLAQRYLIDHGLVERRQDVIFAMIAFLAAAALLVSLLGLAIDYVYARLAVGIVGDLREFVFARCQEIGLVYYETAPRGETLSRFAGDTAAVEHALLQAVAWAVLPLLQVVYSMALMFYFNIWLGTLAAMIFPVMLMLPRYFARKSLDVSYAKRIREARLLGHVSENIALQPVIRAYGYGPQSRRSFAGINARWRQTAFRAAFFGTLVERSAFAGLYVLHVGVFALGVWTVYAGLMSLGTLIVFEALFLAMGESLAYAMEYVPMFAAAAGGVRHIDELLSTAPDSADAPGARALTPLVREIRFAQVGYAYGADGFALHGIDLTIPRGMKIALIGPSGSGKSSLLALLLRFREPTAGAISIDGQDIRGITIASLRARIGFVPQQPLLFGASIRDNIAVGDPSADLDRITQAAVAAEIDPYIRALPQGYDTLVGEGGAALSVGQRQRLCIARALVRDPDILLLDEPTSALDTVTEASINQTLWRLGGDRTVICATHRLAGVVNRVDRIVLLDKGTIRDIGTHAELLARDDLYGELLSS